jgi:hypothetical protein
MSGYVDPFAHRWNRSAEDDLEPPTPEHADPEAEAPGDEFEDEDVEKVAPRDASSARATAA